MTDMNIILTRTPQDGADTIVATAEAAEGGRTVLRTFGQAPRLIQPIMAEGSGTLPLDTPVRLWGTLDIRAGVMEVERWRDAMDCAVSVLVCGGRDFGGRDAVERMLDLISPELIIHGAARGADSLAGDYARRNDIPCRAFPANWRPKGPRGPVDMRAGHDRNQRMLDEGRPDIVLAMPGGGGTRDMVRRSRRQGFAVQVHDHSGTRRYGNPDVVRG